jgi:hypothetical protein
MRRVLSLVMIALAACEGVTDPSPRDGGAIEASAEVPDAASPNVDVDASTIEPTSR